MSGTDRFNGIEKALSALSSKPDEIDKKVKEEDIFKVDFLTRILTRIIQ